MIGILLNPVRRYLRRRRFEKLVRSIGRLGERNRLNCSVRLDARGSLSIGDDCNLSCNFVFERQGAAISVGNRVFMGHVDLISAESITVEDDVFMAWGISVMDHNSHSVHFEDRKRDQSWLPGNSQDWTMDWTVVGRAPVRIGARAWIGLGSIILKGVDIGHDGVVGAGSVVTKSVEPFAIVGGNPARVIGWVPGHEPPAEAKAK